MSCVTIVTGFDGSCVLYFADGRDHAYLNGFFERLTEDQLAAPRGLLATARRASPRAAFDFHAPSIGGRARGAGGGAGRALEAYRFATSPWAARTQ